MAPHVCVRRVADGSGVGRSVGAGEGATVGVNENCVGACEGGTVGLVGAGDALGSGVGYLRERPHSHTCKKGHIHTHAQEVRMTQTQ